MEDAELPPPVPSLPPAMPPVAAEPGAFQPPVDDGSAMVPLAPAPVEPKKSRKGLLIGVGSLAVAGIAVAGFLIARGDDAPSYSLKAASAQANAAKTVAYEMTMKMGSAGETKATASVDNERKLTKMSVDIGALLGTDGAKMDAVMDIKSGLMYMNAGFLGDLGAPVGDAKWIKVDLGDATGVNFKQLAEQSGDPLATAKLFDNAKNVKDLGFAEVNGEKVKHYEVTVDSAEAMKTQPGLQKQLEDSGVKLPETITYNVYVNAANEFRRMQYEMPVEGETVAVDIVVTSVGDPVDVEIPTDGVIDMKDLGG